MDRKTLRALKGSIKKWEGIVAGTERDGGPGNCPLCRSFWSVFGCNDKCPVKAKTGLNGCVGSPYSAWIDAHGSGATAHTPELKKHASAELRFLKSLLPKDAK